MVVDSLLIVAPVVGVLLVVCLVVHYVMSINCSFAIIFTGKRELVALPGLSSWFPVVAMWLVLAMPWLCLRFVIVVFPVHTHLLLLLKRHVIFFYSCASCSYAL